MLLQQIRTDLNITVGTAIDSLRSSDAIIENIPQYVSRELQLLKTALLYADHVTFCSFGPSAIISIMNRPSHLSEDERLEWFLDFYKNLGYEPNTQKIITFINEYKAARQKKKKDFQTYLRYQKAFNGSIAKLDELAKAGGINELNAISKLETVEFKNFGIDSRAEDFVEEISKVLTNGNSYPLLDEYSGNLINLAIEAGYITPIGISLHRARQVGLSANLFTRLPVFDQASVSEIIDIRNELDLPLIRFRSAMVTFSKDIESTPWKKDFSQEADQIFLERVEPAILEIEESYKSNNSLLEILSRSITNQGVIATSVLGIALSQLSQFPNAFAALSISSGLAVGALEVAKERRKKIEETQKNQIYFYYRAGKLLLK